MNWVRPASVSTAPGSRYARVALVTFTTVLLPVVLGITGVISSFGGIAVPPLAGRVNDQGAVLSVTERNSLEAFLRTVEEHTSNQIVVLTIPSLGEEPLEDYAIRVAREWKLGQEGKDNGVLLLVALAERKIRIEVGYGLEGALTDAESKLIITEIMVPLFREGRFAEGIAGGLTAIVKAVEGEFTAEGDRRSSGDGTVTLTWVVFFVILAISSLFRDRRRGRLLPGGYGGFPLGRGPFSGGGFSGGGFSGGGGSFGGGGASGSW